MGPVLHSKAIWVILLFLQAAGAFAQKTPIPAVMAAEAPVIDGDLSDDCWQSSDEITRFFVQTDGADPHERTSVRLCYDHKAIYIAFHCFDSQPDKIMAQQKKRGGTTILDDSVGIYLDCYNNEKTSAWFTVSAGGVQNEGLQSGGVSNIQWRGNWHAASRRTADGYIAEMAIPFSVLHYDPKQTAIGMVFKRQHARTTQTWVSPNIGVNEDIRKSYLWDGLVLPKPKSRPLLLGYTLLGTDEGESCNDVGLDMKYAVTPNLTWTTTVNPDFRGVEQQVDSIDFTYTERYQAESRPFFLEGQGYFPGSRLFYSRRIEEMDAGTKLAGKTGDYDLGFMTLGKLGEQNHSIARLSRAWGDKASLGIAGVYSDTETANGIAGELAAYYCLSKRNGRRTAISALLAPSDSTQHGHGVYSDIDIQSSAIPKQLSWGCGTYTIDENYSPLMGYVPEKGISSQWLRLAAFDQPSRGSIALWELAMLTELKDNTDGSVYDHYIHFAGKCSWRQGNVVSAQYISSDRPPFKDKTGILGIGWNERRLFHSGGLVLSQGRLAGGDYHAYNVYQGFRITDKLKTQVNYEYSTIKAPSPAAFSSDQWYLSATYDMGTNHTLSMRWVNRDGDHNLFVAFKRRVSAGMDVWLTYGDPNSNKMQNRLMLKLVRPFHYW